MTAATASKSFGTRLVQLIALAAVFGAMLLVQEVAPTFHQVPGTIASIGFLLLAAMLCSELLELLGLPHLTGYLLIGLVAGPHVLHLVDHRVVVRLETVNVLALALIALAGGVELRLDVLKATLKSLAWATLAQSLLVLVAMTAVFALLSEHVAFLSGMSLSAILGVALIWGALAVSRSPAATLGILSQTRAEGPLSRFALAFVMSSDVVVILLLALTLALVRPLFSEGAGVSLDQLLLLGHEIVGSVTLGTTLGLLLALYLRLVKGQVLLVLLILGFGVTEGIRYLRFEPLLTFLIAGFVVQNFTRQGPMLLQAIERTGSVVFILFFATAGAHLDLPLLRSLWPIALALCTARAISTFVAHRIGAALANDEAAVKTWGWAPLVSQAGLTLGLSVVVERTFPDFGAGFRSLVIATVAVNEVVGPVLFKLALDRTGETRS